MTNNPITEKEARKLHEKRQQYAVVVGGFESPVAVIQVIKDFVPVTFFDRLLRSVQTLHFHEKEPGRLDLTMATKRQFNEATDAMVSRLQAGRTDPKHQWGQFLAEIDWVIKGESLIFKPDGSTTRTWSSHADRQRHEEPGPHFDASGQSEPYPEFGQYEHLLKRDRGLPW